MLRRRGFVLLVFYTYFLVAQTPIKVTVFSNDSSNTLKEYKPVTTMGPNKNIIKLNYCLFGRGVLLFNYERALTKHFTLEVGLGITYSDFIFTQIYDAGQIGNDRIVSNNTSTSGVNISQNILSNPFDNSVNKIGYAMELSPKFYFSRNEFDGFYISPYLSYRKYNFGLTIDDPNSNFSTSSQTYNDLYYNFLDAGGKIGYNFSISRYSNLYYFDVYAGVARRSVHLNTLMETINNSNYGIDTYIEYIQTFTIPQFMLGAKFGVAF